MFTSRIEEVNWSGWVGANRPEAVYTEALSHFLVKNNGRKVIISTRDSRYLFKQPLDLQKHAHMYYLSRCLARRPHRHQFSPAHIQLHYEFITYDFIRKPNVHSTFTKTKSSKVTSVRDQQVRYNDN